MSVSMMALLCFAIWTLAMVFVFGSWRVSQVVLRGAHPAAFPHGGSEGPGWVQRAHRAHLNCVENLPVFATLVLIGAVIALDDPIFEYAAAAVVPLRMGQSVTHISSGRGRAVQLRFSFFLGQLGCYLVLIARLWMA